MTHYCSKCFVLIALPGNCCHCEEGGALILCDGHGHSWYADKIDAQPLKHLVSDPDNTLAQLSHTTRVNENLRRDLDNAKLRERDYQARLDELRHTIKTFITELIDQ